MRTIILTCCFVFCLSAALLCSNTSSATDSYAGKEVFTRRYIVIDGSGIGAYPKEGLATYDGVKFPLYCGYVTFSPDRTVKFTKKTDLPITDIVEFFDKVEQGKVSIWGYGRFQAAIKRGDDYAIEATTEDELFQAIVLERMLMTYHLYTIKTELYETPPDESFTPKFKEMCTFNSQATPKQLCTTVRIHNNYIKPQKN